MSKKESKEVALRASNLPADLLAEFAPYIDRQAAALATTSTGVLKISTKGGQFKLGERLFGTSIELVVLGSVFENTFFKGAYVEGEMATPDCFALGYDDAGIAPHKDSPGIQGGPHEDEAPTEGKDRRCGTCWANAFGTAARSPSGRGKACQNGYRLTVVHPEELPQLADGKMISAAILRVPPTSRIEWTKFLGGITDGRAFGGKRMPIFAPVIRFRIQPKGGAWQMIPEFVNDKNGDPILSVNNRKMATKLMELATASETQLMQPWVASGPRDAKAGGPKRRKASGAEDGKRYVPVKNKPRKKKRAA